MRAKKVNLRDKKTLSLSSFRGVDYTTSPLEVSSNRATDMSNLIMRDGVCRKRYGWSEKYKFDGRINGIFETRGIVNGKEKSGYLVYAGVTFYFVCDDAKINLMNTCTYAPSALDLSQLDDARVQGFYSGGKLYIVGCGDYLVYGQFKGAYELRRVYNNEDTYIPMTSFNDAGLDEVNMLSPRRKNGWTVPTSTSSSANTYNYHCDGAADFGTEFKLTKNGKDFKSGTLSDSGAWSDSNVSISTATNSSTSISIKTSAASKNDEIIFEFYKTPASANVIKSLSLTFNSASYAKLDTGLYLGNIYYEIPTAEKLKFYINGTWYTVTDFVSDGGGYSSTQVFFIDNDIKVVRVSSGKVYLYSAASKTVRDFKYYASGESIKSADLTDKTWETVTSYCANLDVDGGIEKIKQIITYKNSTSVSEYTIFTKTKFLDLFKIRECTKWYLDANTYICSYDDGTSSIYSTSSGAFDRIYLNALTTSENYYKRITKAKIGGVFGVNGNTNRLFVTGYDKYKNVDYHSEIDDFTYFGDLGYTAFGGDSNAITGYARLSDSTQAVFKEPARDEVTVYFRTGTSEGSTSDYTEYFPVKAGSIGQGVVSPYASATLGNDNLVVGDNGVYAVRLADNVATDERYLINRSWGINARLRDLDLKNAAGTVYKNKYYLSVGNVCYVADGDYMYQTAEGTSYEWWIWDNVPARVWGSTSTLMFGTDEGRVCEFDSAFTDRQSVSVLSGEISVNYSENYISVNSYVSEKLNDGNTVIFNQPIYALVDEILSTSGGRFFGNDVNRLYNGMLVYADNVGASGLSVNTPYWVYDIDKTTGSYKLRDMEGMDVYPTDGEAGIKIYISFAAGEDSKITVDEFYELVPVPRKVYITEISDGTFKLKSNSGTVYTLARYNDTSPVGLTAEVYQVRNVVSKWYTPIFDCGTNAVSKSLLRMVISSDITRSGELKFGYKTRKSNALYDAKSAGKFAFDDIGFDNFSFDTGFASSYTVNKFERNFNYIMFYFMSDSDSDFAVNSFDAIYKLNKTNRGVK